MNIEIEGDPEAEQALRFNVFHLMNCTNPEDTGVSLGAKGLHGEGYKGHVFWDTEIFMLPFFIYTYPQAARAMLMYRYQLLDAARDNARMGGYLGARYPWESADTGKEETPRWGFNYKGERVRIWTGDLEYHYVPVVPSPHVMEQHEGYFNLKDDVITEYDENNMPVWPQDLDTARLNDYTVIKQADIVQLMHMFGEDFDLETKKVNFEYYEKRTMQKSSLSPSIYCIMGLVVGDHSKAYDYLMRTAKVDLTDNQGNTREGLHAASTGGTWQAAVYGFGGMQMESGGGLDFHLRGCQIHGRGSHIV